jgi:hypothetical protein
MNTGCTKPFVPKRLASRLRAAYFKVADARDHLASSEAAILDCAARIQEYEADPVRFAELYYPSVGGPDTYPVQTTISRTREKLERKTDRMQVDVQAVDDAELHMAQVELDVMAELSLLKRSTPGRIAWPTEPESLKSLRTKHLREFQANLAHSRRHALRQETRRAEQAERKKLKAEADRFELEENIKASAALMPPMKAAAYLSVLDALRSAIDSGEFTGEDVMDLAGGNFEAFTPVIEAVKRKVAGTALEDALLQASAHWPTGTADD